jgi:hypothetical protein
MLNDSWETALINALDWLLAEGTITVERRERRVSELLLEVGPHFLLNSGNGSSDWRLRR